MSSEDEFTRRLMGFGLTEKEAQCYFYLLRHGPNTPSPLAKALHTHREDMHRTLNSLSNKGMVCLSPESSTMCTAVELETALDAALHSRQQELREMEQRKRELEELSHKQRFRPSDEVATFKILNSALEIMTATIPIIEHANEFLWVAPKEALVFASTFGANPVVQELVERGGYARGIIDVVYSSIPFVQEVIDIGVEVRHFDNYQGLYFGVFDRRQCVSAINLNVKRVRLDEPATMLYTDDPVYAKYLVSTFEMVWRQTVPAEERIQELLKHGPRQAD